MNLRTKRKKIKEYFIEIPFWMIFRLIIFLINIK